MSGKSAMSDLSNYSIETDHTVLLAFKDGRRLRAQVENLPRYLGPDDLNTISRALKLRRDFIRRHMPKAALVLAAGGLIALAGATTTQLAAWWEHRDDPAPAPAAATPANTPAPIVRNVQSGGDAPAPTPDPAVKETTAKATPKSGSTVATAKKVTKTKRSTKLVISTPVGDIATNITLPLPDLAEPIPTPSPSPTASPTASPSPSASPTPTVTPTPIPNQGQVLGDSTGPEDSAHQN